MIYEHKVGKHHFFIEWNKYGQWGENGETKWVATCQGLSLTLGDTPESVLFSLTRGRSHPTLDGLKPADMGLPSKLEAWSIERI
ncbi:hypothetical protein D3273_26565 [Lichenibacterium minor]|uniref:Uncharacterized protein n=1 Tax=Lichenibacterium minor TaxID=2316528 RepID=A0A4Q2U006_9HYPH|nr:hypothetical protein [Lichenibacterium minor]RYC28948.1 hypothetical protein D3273_26565 [Lichenibacterium minor]